MARNLGRGPRAADAAATGRYADAWVPIVLVRPTDYSRGLEAVRAAASDAGRDPMSITPAAVRGVITGRNRDDVDEALDSVIVKMTALGVPGKAWARHGVEHPMGADFSGVQDLIHKPSTNRQSCHTRRKSRLHL